MFLWKIWGIWNTVAVGSFQPSGRPVSGVCSVPEGSIVPDSLSGPRGTVLHPNISSLGDWGDDRLSAGGGELVCRGERKWVLDKMCEILGQGKFSMML